MPESAPAAAERTLADRVYRRVRGDIVAGVLAPGAKLAMELLSCRYGVGMTPLREALMRLTGEALVVTEGQRGFWVSQVSAAELEDTLDTRLLIESQALSLAIARGGAEWEAAVRAARAELAAIECTLDDGSQDVFARWEAANRRFHDALVSACASPWLLRLHAMLYRHSERYRIISRTLPHIERHVHDEHEALAEAVLARDALRACGLLQTHLQRTREAVHAALAEARAGATHSVAAAKPLAREIAGGRPSNRTGSALRG